MSAVDSSITKRTLPALFFNLFCYIVSKTLKYLPSNNSLEKNWRKKTEKQKKKLNYTKQFLSPLSPRTLGVHTWETFAFQAFFQKNLCMWLMFGKCSIWTQAVIFPQT